MGEANRQFGFAGTCVGNEAVAVEISCIAEEAGVAEAQRISNSAELELQWKRGTITGAEYLERSGAIEAHLAAQGIDVEVLKEQSAEKAAAAIYQQSWADATQNFLRPPAGADWPGGEANKERLGKIIEQLGQGNPDIEKENKVEVLANAWSIMKRNDAQTKAILEAKSPEDIRNALGINSRDSSGFFGRYSPA